MNIRTRNTDTKFMQGNIDLDGEIFDIISDNYGQKAAYQMADNFDFDNAVYSNGFISAINEGLIPVVNSQQENSEIKNMSKEWHHAIVEDTCYIMYFESK